MISKSTIVKLSAQNDYTEIETVEFVYRKGVLEHMRKTGGYTEADFLRVERAQNKPERRKTEDLEPRQDFRSRPDVQPRPEVMKPEEVWSEADFLPAGWKEREGTFLSPQGEIYFSVNEVIKGK